MVNLPDLLLIDKPAGITSFDVIRQLRKRLGIRRMGHAGTLDPAATGLLLIGVGPGTKQLSDFLKLDKEYLAEVVLGVSTTTGDQDGDVLVETPVGALDEAVVEAAVRSLVGRPVLPVSAFSAIKQGGVPLYKRAREAAARGETIADLPQRQMVVYQAELLSVTPARERAILTIRFSVGSGTYIRSLGEELGRRLGYPASLQSLRRTKIGLFDVMHAKQIEEVTPETFTASNQSATHPDTAS